MSIDILSRNIRARPCANLFSMHPERYAGIRWWVRLGLKVFTCPRKAVQESWIYPCKNEFGRYMRINAIHLSSFLYPQGMHASNRNGVARVWCSGGIQCIVWSKRKTRTRTFATICRLPYSNKDPNLLCQGGNNGIRQRTCEAFCSHNSFFVRVRVSY